MPNPGVPTVVALLWPTLQGIVEIGGSGTIDEINERVVEREKFTEEQQAVIHKEGPRTKIEYRLAWARTYLKGMGCVTNSERGVWAVTDQGRGLSCVPGDTPAQSACTPLQERQGVMLWRCR